MNFPLWYEGSTVRADPQANAIFTGDPARALHNQEQLIEAGRVWPYGSARHEVDGVSVRLAGSMREVDTGRA